MMEKYLLLALFGIATAHLEGVVVIYLRQALGIINSQSNIELLNKIPKHYIFIEKTREVATILMLGSLALLVGKTWLDIVVVFFGHLHFGICIIISRFTF